MSCLPWCLLRRACLLRLSFGKSPSFAPFVGLGIHVSKLKNCRRELGIETNRIFDQEAFSKAFSKVREFYIKKGFFDARLEYTLLFEDYTGEVDIEITVQEGSSGHIGKIVFDGFSREEESKLLTMMSTKKHSFFTSWLSGAGVYYEEALAHDKLVIVDFLQNQGFADAQVNIQVKETPDRWLEIFVYANKGMQFQFGQFHISGNQLFTKKQLRQKLEIAPGATFSPEKLHEAVNRVKALYGKNGYIETEVRYMLCPNRHRGGV